MKFIAIEKEIEGADWSKADEILAKEAYRVHELYLEGTLREIYLTEERSAILILESETREHIETAMASLPLVKEGMIEFNISELNPYQGMKRIIK
ncbi:MAG: hypothetical protein JXN65_03745 [Clostridia bacterium]|nr:hypothetical protein [Clostridia bacterium]